MAQDAHRHRVLTYHVFSSIDIVFSWPGASFQNRTYWCHIPRSSTKWYTVNSIWKHSVFAYHKRERYCFNRFCFEMARQITLSIELSWQPEPARFFKTAYWYSSILFWDKLKHCVFKCCVNWVDEDPIGAADQVCKGRKVGTKFRNAKKSLFFSIPSFLLPNFLLA
jgi:hypothetical protein